MNAVQTTINRALLPVTVFALTFGAHFAWFVKSAPAHTSSCCSSGCSNTGAPGLDDYLKTQTFLLGYATALSLAFGSIAIRRFIEQRSRAAQGAAAGGVSLSAFLGFAGCWLSGCCGSPMLGVYISLLGTAFLPFAKPLVASITTLSVIIAAWLLFRAKVGTTAGASCCDGDSPCATPVAIEKSGSSS